MADILIIENVLISCSVTTILRTLIVRLEADLKLCQFSFYESKRNLLTVYPFFLVITFITWELNHIMVTYYKNFLYNSKFPLDSKQVSSNKISLLLCYFYKNCEAQNFSLHIKSPYLLYTAV